MKKKISAGTVVLIACVMLISIFVFASSAQAASKNKIKPGLYGGKYKNIKIKGDSGNITELSVKKKGKKLYASIGIFRLCVINDLAIKEKKNKVTLKGKDPSGNPLTLSGKIKKKKLTLKVTKTSWGYLNKGDSFTYKLVKMKRVY